VQLEVSDGNGQTAAGLRPSQPPRPRVLVVDDDESMCELVADLLASRGYEAVWRTSPEDALGLVQSESFDAVLTDLNMRSLNGLELCERILGIQPELPVLLVTGYGSMQTAVDAIRAGAYDFVTKPVEPDELAMAVERAVQHHRLKQEVQRLREAVQHQAATGPMVGTSVPMRQVGDLLDRLRDTDANVLITGESGTGKELVARALHARSSRVNGPFVAVNCAAVPATLLESELFGHARGAFTDARRSRTGLFVQASGGTLFLDEIAELPVGMQPKLLRALQERRVRPVGGDTELPFDARLVTATNRDLENAVTNRLFRADLFYRINVVRVEVPPLRSRGNDLLLLAQHFIQRAAQKSGKRVTGIVTSAAERLLGYDWPGNVRELENYMERAVALTRFDQVTVEDLPEKIRNYKSSFVVVASDNPGELLPMQAVERRYIQRVLKSVAGNKTRAARVLEFDRRTLHRKLRRYGL
jgi:DNA-binding NtrC family response regulator